VLRAVRPSSSTARHAMGGFGDRISSRTCSKGGNVLGLWWEEGFRPGRAEGFVDAMGVALGAYLRFAGANRLEWAPHLDKEKRLFRSGP
jgi:hypothetical protein